MLGDRIWVAKVILERLRAAAESAREIAKADMFASNHAGAGDWLDIAASIEAIMADSGEAGLEALIRKLEEAKRIHP